MVAYEDILIHIAQPNTSEITALLRERDDFFDILYANEPRISNPINLQQDNLIFFAVRVSGSLAGCGALIAYTGYCELKRFYVRPLFRGRGLGRQLLRTVEDEAIKRQCSILRLETGILQPEAVELYRSSGYARIPPFGQYKANPLSIFMEKRL